ncbi:MAG: universal stress protein [Acidimicrobiia bacterium]
MRRVLAAVDLRPVSRRVVDRARVVAEQTGAELTLLHALEPLADTFVPGPIAARLREHRAEEARELYDWVQARTEVPLDLAVKKGSPDWEIVHEAKRSDLVVVGASSRDINRIGPVALRVVSMARCDVLVVRRQPRVAYRRVVAAVDFSEASVLAVEAAFRLAPDAEVTIVYALPTRFDAQLVASGWFPEELDDIRRNRQHNAHEAMEAFASRWPGRVRTVVSDGPAKEVVEEVARRRGADLVTVSNRGAGATRMVLLGTVADRVMGAVPCDVVVARVPGEFRRP